MLYFVIFFFHPLTWRLLTLFLLDTFFSHCFIPSLLCEQISNLASSLTEHHSKFCLCLWVVPSETPGSTPSSSCSEAPSPSQPQVSFSFSHPCFWAGLHHSPTLIQTLEGNLGFSTYYWILMIPSPECLFHPSPPFLCMLCDSRFFTSQRDYYSSLSAGLSSCFSFFCLLGQILTKNSHV